MSNLPSLMSRHLLIGMMTFDIDKGNDVHVRCRFFNGKAVKGYKSRGFDACEIFYESLLIETTFINSPG